MILDIPKVVKEWSYLVNDGMPDPTNTAHLIKLGQLLIEMKYDPVFVYEYISSLEEAIPDNVLKKKIKNPKTGRQILVSTGLGYKGGKTPSQKAGYGAAKQYLDDEGYDEEDIKSAEEKGKEPEGEGRKVSDVIDSMGTDKRSLKNREQVKASIQAINDSLDNKINDESNPHRKDHEEVKGIMGKMFGGEELSEQDKEKLKPYLRITESPQGSPESVKFYIAQSPNNWKRQGSDKADRIYVGGKGVSNSNTAILKNYLKSQGISEIKTSTWGGKKTAPNQTFVDEKGKPKVIKKSDGKPVASVKKSSSGKIESVKVGSLEIKRLDVNEPGISDKEKVLRDRNNRNMEEYSEAIEKGDLDFIDMNKGVVPDTPENRVTVIKDAIGGMADRYAELAEQAGGVDDETRSIISGLKSFSERDPNEDPEQWFADFKSTMSAIANHNGVPSLSEGWANYAEIYDAIVDMHDNGNGTENGGCALLPESSTLETVDIISIGSRGEGDRKIVTLDGRSVKKGVGGASALTAKVEKSTMKDDPDGKKKEIIVGISKSHDKIYAKGLDKPLEEHQKLQKDNRDNMKKAATRVGVSEEYLSNLEAELEEGAIGHKKIMSALYGKDGKSGLYSERKKKGLPVDDDTMEKLKLRIENYYMYGYISHKAYEDNLKMQLFSNDSIKSQTKGLAEKGEIEIDSSDGVSTLAIPSFEFNVGWSIEGRSQNPGAGRLHNKPLEEV